MICSLELFLLLAFSSSLSAIKCYGASSLHTNNPHVEKKYGELVKTHKYTEFTDCKEYCMAKDIRETYPHWFKMGIAGCGDEECSDGISKIQSHCITSVENSTTVQRTTKLCCCHGEHCYSRQEISFVSIHGPVVEPILEDKPESELIGSKTSSHLGYFVFIMALMAFS